MYVNVCNSDKYDNMWFRVPCCWSHPIKGWVPPDQPPDCPSICYLQHFGAPTPVYYILHTINLYYMYCIYNIQILHIIYHLHLFALSIVYITIIIYYIIL